MKHNICFSFCLVSIIFMTDSPGVCQGFRHTERLDRLIHVELPRSEIMSLNPINGRSMISLPLNQTYYTWDDTADWQLRFYSEMSYLENGKVDSMTNYLYQGGPAVSRTLYIYDAEGRPSEFTVQNYSGGWQNSSRTDYDYDEHGNQTENLYNIWFNLSWTLTSGSKSIYTYNVEGFMLENLRQNYNFITEWYNSSRDIYEFDGGSFPVDIVMQEWNVSFWVNSVRMVDLDILEYDAEHGIGTYNSYTLEKWDGSAWIADARYTYTFSPDYPLGGYSYIEQVYRQGNWIDTLRYSEIVDENNMVSEFKTETWIEGQWQQTEGNRYFYTINGIDLTQIISQIWSDTASMYVNDSKIVYGDFIHIEGLKENTVDIGIYPNPAHDFIRINIDKPVPEGTISIIDLSGKEVGKIAFSWNIPDISIDNLPNGLYFLKFEGIGSSHGSAKFLKY